MAVPVGPLIQLGGVLLGGLFGRKSREEKEAERASAEQARLQTTGMREAIGLGREFAPAAGRLMRMGGRAISPAVDYWQRILSGRTPAVAALAPEINQIIESYRAARTAGRAISPRGALGGTSALTRHVDEALVPGQIAGLLATARPAAAGQLGTLGTNLLGRGIESMQTVGQLFGRGAGAGAALLQYGPQSRRQATEFGEKLGGALEPIIRSIPWGEIFGRTTPTGTPTPPKTGGPVGSATGEAREVGIRY